MSWLHYGCVSSRIPSHHKRLSVHLGASQAPLECLATSRCIVAHHHASQMPRCTRASRRIATKLNNSMHFSASRHITTHLSASQRIPGAATMWPCTSMYWHAPLMRSQRCKPDAGKCKRSAMHARCMFMLRFVNALAVMYINAA